MYFTVRFYSACKDKMGQGDGTPLQHSCLENPMDGGAWWAAVHGVTKSRTQLSDFTFTFHFHALEKDMATRSSVLAWRILRMREPGEQPSMGLHRVGHDWSDLAETAGLYSLPGSSVHRIFRQDYWSGLPFSLLIHSCYCMYKVVWVVCSPFLCNCIVWIQYNLFHSSFDG